MMTKAHGFSLIESIICVMIMSILTMAAFPSMAQLLQSSSIAGTSNRLLAELNRARYEAVMRHAQITLCATADAHSCVSGKNWSTGLMSYVDNDRDHQRDPNEPILGIVQKQDLNGLLLQTSDGRPTISFRADGGTAGTNVTLRLCATDLHNVRRIIINLAGRSRVDTGSASYNCADSA